MIVAVHQPQYLPWLGYFDKMDRCDLFVFLDSVQFKKNEWQNRNRIKTASGWQYLTVPVRHRFPQSILDVQIDNRADWARKHLQALMVHYGKAPYFADHLPFLQGVYGRRWDSLCELCIVLIQYLTAAIGITVKVARSSEGQFSEEPTERLIKICRWAGADAYLAGAGGLHYMRLDRLRQEGIQVVQQAFESPMYPQLYGRFEPNLSVVDLLFNCGPASLEILRGSRKGTRPTGPSPGKEEA
ncbi:MAG: WbqC family protein [candidate division NC10 bacterium]|nr:WbqC family protein [candidate division NC10 bacterium]MDE2485683.1 WbqC family protein [candidate division NC10 bacterium]